MMRLATPQLFHISQRLARWCAVAIGFAVPISVALDNLLLALIALFWLASGNYRSKLDRIRANPVALSALALFAVLSLGTLYGPTPIGEAAGFLGKYLDLLFIPIFISLFEDETVRRNALNAFLASMLLTLALSCLIGFGWLGQNSILRGTSLNPVVFKLHITQNFFMSFAAFALFVLARDGRSPGKRLALAVLAAIASFNLLIMVQGRIGYVVFAVLVAYVLTQQFRWRGLAAAIGVCLVLGGTLYNFSSHFHDRIATAAGEFANWHPGTRAAADSSIGQRMEFYRNTLALISHHPWFGVGTGGFAAAYHEQAPQALPTQNPHNEYMLIMVQTGIPGLVALSLLFLAQFRATARLPEFEKRLGQGILLAMISGCIFNSFMLDHAEGLFFAWMSGVSFSAMRNTA